MKTIKKMTFAALLAATTLMTGCENADVDFPDYDGGISAYFPYQTPIRTLILGTDEYEGAVELDHQHKFKIMATMGGSYSGRDINLGITVDESLIDNLQFKTTGQPVVLMPSNYYQLESSSIDFKGDVKAGVVVSLTDDFFRDPKSCTLNYVIPVRIVSSANVDHVIAGEAADNVSNPVRTCAEDWKVAPMDYTLYAVKYISKYHAYYVRLGEDQVTYNGKTVKQERAQSLMSGVSHSGSDDEIVSTSTIFTNQVKYPVEIKIGEEGVDQKVLNYNLILTFDDNDNCTITSGTSGVTISGSGYYGTKTEKLAWGNKDRDGMHLDYTVEYEDGTKIVSKDILVWRNHGVNMPEEFEMVYTGK